MAAKAALLALLLTTAGPVAAQTPPPPAAVKSPDAVALEALNAQWLNAYVSRDRTALEAVLAPEFVVFRPGGGVTGREALIASAVSPERNVTAVRWENLQIQVFGDVAVVAARSTLTGTQGARDISGSNDYADVYVRRDGRWLAVAAHIVRRPVATP